MIITLQELFFLLYFTCADSLNLNSWHITSAWLKPQISLWSRGIARSETVGWKWLSRNEWTDGICLDCNIGAGGWGEEDYRQFYLPITWPGLESVW